MLTAKIDKPRSGQLIARMQWYQPSKSRLSAPTAAGLESFSQGAPDPSYTIENVRLYLMNSETLKQSDLQKLFCTYQFRVAWYLRDRLSCLNATLICVSFSLSYALWCLFKTNQAKVYTFLPIPFSNLLAHNLQWLPTLCPQLLIPQQQKQANVSISPDS